MKFYCQYGNKERYFMRTGKEDTEEGKKGKETETEKGDIRTVLLFPPIRHHHNQPNS